MLGNHSPLPTLVLVCCSALLMACDPGEDADDTLRQQSNDTPLNAEDVNWDTVPLPAHVAEVGDLAPNDKPAVSGDYEELGNFPASETFVYTSTGDTIAVTSAPGGLFPPFPSGIPTFDDPLLANGFLAAVTVRDVNDAIVGFGTEQELLDFQSEIGETTYTLTLPGRGTLMLEQLESPSAFLDEIEDMIANQDYVRTYDPPLVDVHTLPGTGRIIGGTGEFEDAKGHMREIGVTHGIDLINGAFDLEVVLQVKYN